MSSAVVATPLDILAQAAVLASHEVSSASNDRIRHLFQRYQELEEVVQGNASKSSEVPKLQASVKDFEQHLAAAQGNLHKTQAAASYTRKRLYRNAHPRFLHYLQIGRESKVRRLEQEVENLERQVQELQSLDQSLQARLSSAKQQLTEATVSRDRCEAARKEMLSIIDHVATSNGTTTLRSLLSQVQQSNTELSQDIGILSSLERVMVEVQHARALFSQAHQELRRAARDNQAAEGEAAVDMMFLATNDMYEEGLQADRDNMINMAKQTSYRAGQMLQAAFNAFPMEARVRFPEITRNVCNAPIPVLQGANFGDAFMADFFIVSCPLSA
jgi:chromosome segregation ATPase